MLQSPAELSALTDWTHVESQLRRIVHGKDENEGQSSGAVTLACAGALLLLTAEMTLQG